MEVELRKKELGEILKAERAKQDLSIEDIHTKTKVQPRFIKAIECGSYQILPSQVAGIGFIRLYATLLGINPEPLVLEYREKTSAPPAPISLKSKSPPPSALSIIDDLRIRAAVAGLLAVIALAALFFILRRFAG